MAVGSVDLLWLALAQGWLGADVGRGDGFCEAARDQLVRQPVNTLSNEGFVLAAHRSPGTSTGQPILLWS